MIDIKKFQLELANSGLPEDKQEALHTIVSTILDFYEEYRVKYNLTVDESNAKLDSRLKNTKINALDSYFTDLIDDVESFSKRVYTFNNADKRFRSFIESIFEEEKEFTNFDAYMNALTLLMEYVTISEYGEKIKLFNSLTVIDKEINKLKNDNDKTN